MPQPCVPPPWWFLLPTLLGLAVFCKTCVSLFSHIILPLLRHVDHPKTYGPWALVTGSTDGIGKAIAFRLARRGLNLVLLSRCRQKLTEVAGEIESKFPGILTRILPLDLSCGLSVRAIEDAIDGADLGVVVNNAGVSYPEARYFHELPVEEWIRLVKVNIEGTTKVTAAVLPRMVERRRGAIVNIGSGSASVLPSFPLSSVYSATKAYVAELSKSLCVEYGGWGIEVQCQVPLFVATKMVDRKKASSFFCPTADDYALAAVRVIGLRGLRVPYWTHVVQWRLGSLVPECVLDTWRLAAGIRQRRLPEDGRARGTCSDSDSATG